MHSILIVDDHSTLLSALKAALEDEYLVSCAQSGEEALEIIRILQPDVIVTDQELGGMSGLEIIQSTRGLRAESGKMKIILMSAKMDFDLKNQAQAVGADVCLAKPFDLWALHGCLKRLLSK